MQSRPDLCLQSGAEPLRWVGVLVLETSSVVGTVYGRDVEIEMMGQSEMYEHSALSGEIARLHGPCCTKARTRRRLPSWSSLQGNGSEAFRAGPQLGSMANVVLASGEKMEGPACGENSVRGRVGAFQIARASPE